MKRLFLLGVLFTPLPAFGLELVVPNATLVTTETLPADTVRLPDAAWDTATPVATQTGSIVRRVLRAPGGTRTTSQLMAPLAEALEAEGFEEVFTCADRICGGFDFRFQLDLIGEPQMHVDLGDYRYFLARKEDEGLAPHTVSIVTSRSADAGYVHITEVSAAAPVDIEEFEPSAPDAPVVARAGGSLIDALVTEGRAVLEDLDFGSGAATLGPGPHPSLEALAGWLEGVPEARIVLVGHTDAVGSLEANTALSLERARAVADRLVDDHGANRAQVAAEGAGYLAPRASNLSDTGRAANRRVEVVLLSAGIEE